MRPAGAERPAAAPGAGLSAEEFDTLRRMIEAESGIALRDDKRYLLESRLRPLLGEFSCTNFAALHTLAATNQHPLVRQRIVDAITTNETFWFRDKTPFVILEEVFLPLAVKLILGGRPKIRIWSAACSTGQETYSISMTIHNYLKQLNNPAVLAPNFEILATDISDEALSIAQLGAYDKFSMGRGLDPENLETYFKHNQDFWIVDPALKRPITFKKLNLQDSFAPLGRFDVVFCRNVAIYFSNEFKVDLFRKIHDSLHPDWMFFLGSTESLSFMSHNFVGREHKRGMYYQAAPA